MVSSMIYKSAISQFSYLKYKKEILIKQFLPSFDSIGIAYVICHDFLYIDTLEDF